MTVVIAVICDNGNIVVGSDSAIGYESGYRRLMADGKWWNMGCLMIGESGSDFALSRIRQKTVKHEPWTDLRDPYTFSELVCEVQTEVKGLEGTEPIDAELLHIAGDKEGKPLLNVIGGDGGITGPFPHTAVGHGAMPALPLLDALLKPSRVPKKTVIKVTNIVLEILQLTSAYADSVSPPHFIHVFDPAADFKELQEKHLTK
jgi:20S proteasome alpha/beta subunit